MKVTINKGKAHGTIVAPPSKSVAHRMLICGGLARHGEILLPFMKKYLEEDVIPEFSTEPSVNAAVLLAGKITGEKSC